MDTNTLDTVLSQTDYDVSRLRTAEDALAQHRSKPFDLVLLCRTDDEAVALSDQLHNGDNTQRSMIVAVVEDGDTSSLPPALYAHIDDCFEIHSKPEVLRSRLRFIEERAIIRSKNAANDQFHTAEVERINVELTAAVKEHQTVLEALGESEAKVRAILETTVDGIITIDNRGIIETFNRAAEKSFGYKSEEVIGNNVSMLMPANDSRQHDQYIRSYLDTGVAKIIGIGRETLAKRKDGSLFPIELSIGEINVSGKQMFTGMIRDITDRRRLEQEILRISESERRRIGQDLHDGLGQALTGIGLILQNLAKTVRPRDAQIADSVDELTVLVKEADQLARNIARSLVPVEVESNGLAFALRILATNSERLFDIKCSFRDPGETLIQNNSIATHLYRIAQEAVSNAVRHGKANSVDIQLESTNEYLVLSISDNGKGFDNNPNQRTGMGLRIMHYRSRMIRGQFLISPNESGGTVVICRVPKDHLNSRRLEL